MANLMDKTQFSQVQNQTDIRQLFNQARQNPQAFEEQMRRLNPQGYNQALQIRNSINNPQEVVIQMLQQRGFNPNVIQLFNL